MKVLLVDIPTYQVVLPEYYRKLLSLRLQAEAEIRARRLGLAPIRPGLAYSRGLLTVAAGLKQAGHHVKYRVYSDEEDRQRLPGLIQEADILGITALTATVGLTASICELAKSIKPSIVSVVGGPHIKAVPEETLQIYPSFDIAVIGPGEIILPDLISNLQNLAAVPKVAFRGQDGNIERSQGPLIPKEIPNVVPAYELLHRSLGQYAHNIRTQDGCL